MNFSDCLILYFSFDQNSLIQQYYDTTMNRESFNNRLVYARKYYTFHMLLSDLVNENEYGILTDYIS
jgi:hypothetical protein